MLKLKPEEAMTVTTQAPSRPRDAFPGLEWQTIGADSARAGIGDLTFWLERHQPDTRPMVWRLKVHHRAGLQMKFTGRTELEVLHAARDALAAVGAAIHVAFKGVGS